MSLLEPWDLGEPETALRWAHDSQQHESPQLCVQRHRILVAAISHTVSIYIMKIIKCSKAVLRPTPLPRQPVVINIYQHITGWTHPLGRGLKSCWRISEGATSPGTLPEAAATAGGSLAWLTATVSPPLGKELSSVLCCVPHPNHVLYLHRPSLPSQILRGAVDLRGDILLMPTLPSVEEEHTNTTLCGTAGTSWDPQHLTPAHLLGLPTTSAPQPLCSR